MKHQILGFLYKIAKYFFFKVDAELVHNCITMFGELLGNTQQGRDLVRNLFYFKDKKLTQNVAGLKFDNPIGLSAGFDYEAKLTQILPEVGFGFATVGTITNLEYKGNPSPRMGRLPKSKSLLVNKGFKTEGVDAIIERLQGLSFEIPIGISVGRSNSSTLKTVDQSIEDIALSFEKLKKANLKNAYWELNISCPNLIHGGKGITFYPPRNLEKLLTHIDKLKLKKPLLIKMPITEENKSFTKMLDVIIKHRVSGVIIGNLQKDRKNPAFDKFEIKNAGKGNFSGAPCFKRSNELIALTYKSYSKRLTIIGCGGVFNAYDAYEKIKLGASLVMMITGIVYEGPQLIGQINRDLVELLKRDGYDSISRAVGATHSL